VDESFQAITCTDNRAPNEHEKHAQKHNFACNHKTNKLAPVGNKSAKFKKEPCAYEHCIKFVESFY